MHIQINLDLPEGTQIGDVTSVIGSVTKASTEYVDWERLYQDEYDAVSIPGKILMDIAHQMECQTR